MRTPKEHSNASQVYQEQKRARGLCACCGRRPTTINPVTGFPKWLCVQCGQTQTTRQRANRVELRALRSEVERLRRLARVLNRMITNSRLPMATKLQAAALVTRALASLKEN